MDANLRDNITDRLRADYGLKTAGKWLRQGKCPSCSKKELFTHAQEPWLIRCGRLNKCAWEGHVKDLYPEAFADFSKRFAPTETDPLATAKAYLSMVRQLPLEKIAGWFTQGSFYDPKKKVGTATVRFEIADGVYWERFIDKERQLGRKAHFHGRYKAMVWVPPGVDVSTLSEVWIVEGIFDAIALTLAGTPAVAALSCNNYPSAFLEKLDEGVKVVFALDPDTAGKRYMRKHVATAREAGFEAEAFEIPTRDGKKRDWNDLYARKQIDDWLMNEGRFLGAMLLADSAEEKARLIYNRRSWREFSVVHRDRTYWFKLDVEKLTKAQQEIEEGNPELSEQEINDKALEKSGNLTEIANCAFDFLYFQSNAITDESWYYTRIRLPMGKQAEVNATFTGGQLASASEFKKRLLSVATGAVWTGSSQQLDRILKNQLGGLKVVDTIDFTGYSPEHEAWLLGDLAVHQGRVTDINGEDFFDLSNNGRPLSVKSLSQSVRLAINPDLEELTTDWMDDLYGSYQGLGVIALAYWMGSLFAEQIRDAHKSYPFLEIVGEPGAGKSTLIEFLWKLVGRRDYEGFDPSKSTLAARSRNFAQVSNLPVVLIEADRDEDIAKSKRFDWDEMKTAYNGRASRSRGHKNSGNETYEPPFRGALVISQNDPVNASEAILQRIVHLGFTRDGHNPGTKAMAERLERIPTEDVSGWILQVTKRENQVMETFLAKTPEFERKLMDLPEIKSVRIAKNHAQIMALVEALGRVMQMPAGAIDEAKDWTVALALERQQAIEEDHPIVKEFWEAFEFLNDGGIEARLNHARDSDLIAVNLNEFVEQANARKQQVPPIIDLKRHLKTSKRYKFMANNKVVKSGIRYTDASGMTPKSVRCWVFQRG